MVFVRVCVHVIWVMNCFRSQLAPERPRWSSKNCLPIFNHRNNHSNCWNRTDQKPAACYLRPAVAPLWVPLHDKHLSLSEPSAALSSLRKLGPVMATVNLLVWFCSWMCTVCHSEIHRYTVYLAVNTLHYFTPSHTADTFVLAISKYYI